MLNKLSPGGSDRLDALSGADHPMEEAEYAWRTWVDETVVSWAANLLADPHLATTAGLALSATDHGTRSAADARRLTISSPSDQNAAPLLRHPDLTGQIAGLHCAALLALLAAERRNLTSRPLLEYGMGESCPARLQHLGGP